MDCYSTRRRTLMIAFTVMSYGVENCAIISVLVRSCDCSCRMGTMMMMIVQCLRRVGSSVQAPSYQSKRACLLATEMMTLRKMFDG